MFAPRDLIKIACLTLLAFVLGIYTTFQFLVLTYSTDFETFSSNNYTFSGFNCTENNLINISGVALKACILQDSVYVQICQGQPYFTSCVLLEDLDFGIICKHVPLAEIKGIADAS